MNMYQVDAFTQVKFKGNPAAVLILDEWLSDELMQNIALENNLAETAFVKKIDAQHFAIRWFTPTTEVDFCGHATLASSFVLFKYYGVADKIYFHVKKLGTFIVSCAKDGRIVMNFPVRRAEKIQDYPQLLRQALSQPFKHVYLNEQAYIIEYETVQQVLDEKPNFELLKQLTGYRTAITADASYSDIAITAQSQRYDCVSRYFAPAHGIPEDPVTGSIHTAIAPLWAEKLAKTSIIAYQASTRGGTLYCEILADDRIEISGYAQLVLHAELYL